MATLVGADGYKEDWLTLSLDTATGEIKAAVTATADLLVLSFDALAIDIPIGLPDSGSREADRLARAFVGPRRSSVFPSPIRPALRCSTRPEACTITNAINGNRVGVQAFALFPKIAQVVDLLQAHPELAARTYEVHPEVSFRQWAEEHMRHYKKSPAGKQDRQALIAAEFGPDVFARLQRESPVRLPDDDLADAFAALWSAKRIFEGDAARLPGHIVPDAAGFPMNIWY